MEAGRKTCLAIREEDSSLKQRQGRNNGLASPQERARGWCAQAPSIKAAWRVTKLMWDLCGICLGSVWAVAHVLRRWERRVCLAA